MMTENPNEPMIQAQKEYRKTLMEQYAVAVAQKSKIRSDAEQVTQDQIIADLENCIKLVDAKIAELRLDSQSASERLRVASQQWEAQIHKINYSKVEKTIRPVFENLKLQEGAALFLMKKSQDMGAKWCHQKLRAHIEQDLGSLIKLSEVRFLYSEGVGVEGFLSRLAGCFAVDMSDGISDVKGFTKTLIDTIVASLVSGNILFLKIDIATLSPQNRFLEWFVNDFWGPLIARLPAISSKRPRIRMIAQIAVDGPIPKACLPEEICCKKTTFNGGKLLTLPLQNWTEVEIAKWIYDFSGLTTQATQLNNESIGLMAKNIHGSAKGNPWKVYHKLTEEMKDCICSRV